MGFLGALAGVANVGEPTWTRRSSLRRMRRRQRAMHMRIVRHMQRSTDRLAPKQ